MSQSQDVPDGVDVHAHFFARDLADRVRSAPDDRWPVLVVDDASSGRIMLGDRVFREVRAALWDVDARLAEMDAAGIGLQVLSPVPVMLAYWAQEQEAVDYARATNDALADAVSRSAGRLLGLGALPLPHVGPAVDELRRAVRELGLRGVEVGSQVGGLDLDDAALRPFWAEAEALGAAVFVHPMDGGAGVLRRPGQPLGFGLGMTTDTAVAASALVFGGVLEAFPRLRAGLAHGCGTFPWAYPRLSLGAEIFSGVARGTYDPLVRSLWADSLVFDPALLPLLLARFGADHVVLGTDHPFVAGQFEGARAFLAQAQRDGVLDAEQARAVWRENGLAFVGGQP